MKPVYGLLIVFLLLVRVSFAQGEDNPVLDQRVDIEVKNESIALVLEKISSLTQVYFSYDPILIEADKRIDASLTSKSIREILDAILPSRFSYQVLDNQVIITLPEDEPGESAEDSIAAAHAIILFQGRVMAFDEKDPLPYSSISVLKQNIGTISNTDGDFELKLPGSMINDTVIVSCMGYRQFRLPVRAITGELVTVYLQPASIQLQEVKVIYISPEEILRRMEAKIPINYAEKANIMTSFYREVLKQDRNYIDVAEAVLDIRKASYNNLSAEDKVKFIKGRKSMNVKPFQFVDFKIQGGPYYITKLDVIKTLDSFLDPEYIPNYKYTLEEIIEHDNRSTYVIAFKPRGKEENIHYQGRLYVDMSSFALVKAEFEMNRAGLKFAQQSLIQKKPKGFYVRPVEVQYRVNYRRSDTKWHLSNAQASIEFRVRSKKDRINSLFHSISELLVTDFKPDDGTRFKRNELVSSKDIFTEMIPNDDDQFWGDYNIIKPSQDLRKALEKYYLENDSLFNTPLTPEQDQVQFPVKLTEKNNHELR
ncbi:MAG TPA: carboxypeptidase-like regulatory domain-containing protein [Prolixibacteraceae bacterium]|nr:carboxypeptidase-like regulatory domain-containing protein [Prolixibacteraceae bacterium]